MTAKLLPSRMLTDEQIMNAACTAADALDATRVSEMKAGGWHATTIFDGDTGLLRFGRLIEKAMHDAAPSAADAGLVARQLLAWVEHWEDEIGELPNPPAGLITDLLREAAALLAARPRVLSDERIAEIAKRHIPSLLHDVALPGTMYAIRQALSEQPGPIVDAEALHSAKILLTTNPSAIIEKVCRALLRAYGEEVK